MDTIWGGRYLIGYWFVGDVICANVMKIYKWLLVVVYIW